MECGTKIAVNTNLATEGKWDVNGLPDQKFIVKAELCDDPSRPNRNHAEWESYINVPVLRSILPKVLGYFESEVGEKQLCFLLVERVGFTFATMLQQFQRTPVNAKSLGLVCECTVRVVEQMRDIVVQNIHLYDWHTGNIGFMDVNGAPCKLLDWEKFAFKCFGILQRQDESCILQASFFFPILGTICMCHSKSKRYGSVYLFVHRSGKMELENVMRFPNHLLHFDTSAQCSVNQKNPHSSFANNLHWGSSGLWKNCLKELSEICRWWWYDWCTAAAQGDDLPNDSDLDALWNLLHSAMDESVRQVQQESKPSRSSQQQDVDDEEESVWNLLSIDPMDAENEMNVEDDASWPGMTSQLTSPATNDTSMLTELAPEDSARNDMSMLTEPDFQDSPNQDEAPDKYFAFVTPEDQEEVETLRQCLTHRPEGIESTFLVGQEAARSLIAQCLARQRRHAKKLYRHGRKITEKSKTLEDRIAEEDWELFKPPHSKEDFDKMGILFRILLSCIQRPERWCRLKRAPLAAKYTREFHRLHAKTFLDRCKPSWTELSWDEKENYLLQFLISQFSYDPKVECMNPSTGEKRKGRNDACWEGFWLGDQEVADMANTIISEYRIEVFNAPWL